MLAPWLKFVWESYKQCLDLLKNNNRVEKIYQEVAQMGFRFCQQYNRRPEFRKLCDTIRTHFTQSQKYSQQMYSVNFQLPETQALHLETRLLQLDTAIAMELWQEAFKAVEDIHAFTTISKKTPKPPQLASYYSKVALVFWKAGNYVFHATTVLKLYVLHKEQKKNITHAELSRLSTKACKTFLIEYFPFFLNSNLLVLSILSIPLPTPRTQIDEHLETEETISEKQKRLTSLLSLQQIPTRASLIRDMIKQGVLNFVYPELKNMYEWLEVEFNPLKLSAKMEESIQFVEKLAQPEYSQYMPALRDVTVVRLLQQISQVYQTIELKRFIDLAPPMDKHRLEKIIVNAAKNNDVQVRIEHKSKALTFGTDLNLSNGQSTANETASKTSVIQKMPNEQIRNQLMSISRALYASMEVINDKAHRERNDKLRREIAQTYYRDQLNQRKDMLKRRDLIERYKEEKEKESKDKVRLSYDLLSEDNRTHWVRT
jgi:translation initiation factor 3 subunit A